jgi:hypothetical protein
MAVSNRVLGLLAATVACLALWSLLGPTPGLDRTPRRSGPERAAEQALRDSAVRLGRQVGTAVLLDRVDSALRSHPAGADQAVITLGTNTAAARVAESLYTSIPRRVDPAVPTRLVLLDWPAEKGLPLGTLTSFAVLPGTKADERCTVLHTSSPGDTILDRYYAEDWRRLPWNGAVGACWYLSEFGLPGPGIRAWLDARYWDVAGGIPPYRLFFESRDDAPEPSGMLNRVFGDLRELFYTESVALEACADRRPEVCEAAFLQTPYPPGQFPAGVVGSWRVLMYSGQGSGAWMFEMPRRATASLLALMVDDLGPTRFAQFWTSNAPVGEAFASASGMSLGEWYRLQLRRELKDAGYPDPRRIPFWPSAIGILALTLGGSLWHAKRRQVR